MGRKVPSYIVCIYITVPYRRETMTANQKRTRLLSAACYVVFILMSIFIILLKKQMHVDEFFSYGSANHIGSMHIEIEDGRTYVPSNVPYLNYMTADQNNRYNYINVWRNQAEDVHPPLYYAVLHTICSMFPGRFSFWFAGAINIAFGVMTLYVLRKLFRLYCGKDAPVNLLSVIYVVSAGVMSSISFFRMYTMAMFFVTWTAFCFADAVGKARNVRFYAAIAAVSVLGALTHYYCIAYLVLTCFIFGIYLLSDKKYKELGLFVGSMLGAGGLSILIFPSIVKHIFTGYRGKESIDNLLAHSLENDLFRLREFWGYINTELFGGTMPLILLMAVLLCILRILAIRKRNEKPDGTRFFRWAVLAVPVVCYFFLIAKTAVYISDRYLFPVYAAAVCLFVSIAFLTLKRLLGDRKIAASIAIPDLAMLLLSGAVILSSWAATTWNYIYRSEAQRLASLETYRDTDCIVVYDHRWKAESAFLEVSIYKSVTFFPLADPELLGEFDLSSDHLIVLAIGNHDEILRQITDSFPNLNQYAELGSYAYSTTYYFYQDNTLEN